MHALRSPYQSRHRKPDAGLLSGSLVRVLAKRRRAIRHRTHDFMKRLNLFPSAPKFFKKFLTKAHVCAILYSVVGMWCSGSTRDFDSCSKGSTPFIPAKRRQVSTEACRLQFIQNGNRDERGSQASNDMDTMHKSIASKAGRKLLNYIY